MANAIREVTLRPVGAPDETSEGAAPVEHALFIELDVPDASQLPALLEAAVARFAAEQSGATPARYMLITVDGDVPAADFALAWQAAIVHDPAARALLGMLHRADVIQRGAGGVPLGQASLLGGFEPVDEDVDDRRVARR